MENARPLLHEILNALTIARGLTEHVESVLEGATELTPEEQQSKLKRAIAAMDRIETAAIEIQTILKTKDN